MPLQVWQIKEKAKLDKSGAHLATLALNTRTSNEAFYRAAVFEAVNVHRRKRARQRRAREAGMRVPGDSDDEETRDDADDGDDVERRKVLNDGSLSSSKHRPRKRNAKKLDEKNPGSSGRGVEVLNKDTIDPQTVKRLGKQQVDDILAICKRHKWLVDTAKAGINTKLDPVWEARLSTNKLALQRKEIRRSRKMARQTRTLSDNNKKSKSSGYGRAKPRRQGMKSNGLGPASSIGSVASSTSTLTSSSTELTSLNPRKNHCQEPSLPSRYVRDEQPDFDFPLTLKNFNTRRVVQGWQHGAKKLDWLIRTAVSALDTAEPDSRRRLREDKKRKARIARKSGLGDPEDVRPGEFGLSFSEKQHWRMHLDQLNELIETAPVRISAKIDPHVKRIWNLNRKRGRKDVEKTRGMSSDFALTLKRSASRMQLQSWSDAVEQLWDMCAKAQAKIDNDWGARGPPKSVRGQGTEQIPNASVSSRKGNAGGAGRWGERSRGSVGKSRSGDSLPELTQRRQGHARRRNNNSESLEKGLKKSFAENQLQVSCVEGLEHADGLAISMQFYLGGKEEMRKQTQKEVKAKQTKAMEDGRSGNRRQSKKPRRKRSR